MTKLARRALKKAGIKRSNASYSQYRSAFDGVVNDIYPKNAQEAEDESLEEILAGVGAKLNGIKLQSIALKVLSSAQLYGGAAAEVNYLNAVGESNASNSVFQQNFKAPKAPTIHYVYGLGLNGRSTKNVGIAIDDTADHAKTSVNIGISSCPQCYPNPDCPDCGEESQNYSFNLDSTIAMQINDVMALGKPATHFLVSRLSIAYPQFSGVGEERAVGFAAVNAKWVLFGSAFDAQ